MLALLLLSLAPLMLGGCNHDDPPVIIDADEILRYMDEVGIAKELFRTTGLISEQPYTLPFVTGTVTDRVLGVKRTRYAYTVPLKILSGGDSVYNSNEDLYMDYGSLGEVREGLVEVEDIFTIETKRATQFDTVYDTSSTTLYRYGFFLKAGSDAKPYVGWILYGFRGFEYGASALAVEVESSGGADFFHTQIYDQIPKSKSQWIPHAAYERLTYMDTIRAGELVHCIVSSSGASVFPTISDYDSTGLFTRSMTRYMQDDVQEDSLSYRLPDTVSRLYNLILIQRFTSGAFPSRTIFAIPYRSQ